MRRGVRQRLSPFSAGLVALVVLAVGIYFGFTKANPFADRFELSAAFKTANDIKKGAQVRIAGVNIGKVTAVRADGNAAILTMQLRDEGLPIHQDATMKIRPRIFLEGNWFVDLSPGSPSAPIVEEGATIPVQQTSAPVQFGQILTALQSDTRQDLQKVLDEYGRALVNGGAKGYNRSIPYWKEAFRDSAIVNEATLGIREHDLSGYIDGADKFARALDRDPEALKSLLTGLAVTGDALASESAALTASVHELPRTLSIGSRALGELNGAFPELRALVTDLRPATRSSGPALDAALPLIKQLRGLVRDSELRGLVRDLRAIVPDLTELNEGGVGVQQELRLLSSCSNEVVVPWRNATVPDAQFPASGPVFQEQVKWMPGIAAESRNFDANGQYVRSLANGANYAYGVNDGRFFLSGLPIQGVNPPKAPGIPPLRADVPCETQQPPDLRTIPGQPPQQIKVNRSNAGYRSAVAKGREKALRWMRGVIKREGGTLKLADSAFTRADFAKLSKGMPRR